MFESVAADTQDYQRIKFNKCQNPSIAPRHASGMSEISRVPCGESRTVVLCERVDGSKCCPQRSRGYAPIQKCGSRPTFQRKFHNRQDVLIPLLHPSLCTAGGSSIRQPSQTTCPYQSIGDSRFRNREGGETQSKDSAQPASETQQCRPARGLSQWEAVLRLMFCYMHCEMGYISIYEENFLVP